MLAFYHACSDIPTVIIKKQDYKIQLNSKTSLKIGHIIAPVWNYYISAVDYYYHFWTGPKADTLNCLIFFRLYSSQTIEPTPNKAEIPVGA